MIDWPDLRDVLGDLRWVVVGGVATRAYMPERMTADLDVLVSSRDALEARRRLEAAGYAFSGALSIPGIVLRSPAGVEIDLLFGDAPWLEEALAAPRRDAADFPVIGLPILVLMKMAATRDQD